MSPPRRTLLSAARRARIRIGHPCRGEGVCGKCDVRILEGGELLEPPTEGERALLLREACEADARMSCLAVPAGSGTVVIRMGGGSFRIPLKAGPGRVR
ncbi:MAG TPA: 2Fe-2S iron-sulfur cluster-binding protein [Vulgatibacter sp.]|nr:2Fe-2S iron-sulfur cluster-binding protein [Vulgatibacter sp.]